MILAIRLATVLTFCLAASVGSAAANRVALVLGQGAYQTIEPLSNTRNDAQAMANTLSSIGFDVTLALDATSTQLFQLLDDFAFRAETADLALIYYAGHGVEVQGENFLIPVDAKVSSNRDVQRQSVSLKQLLAAVEHARKMRVVILDSCRNNPLGDLIDINEPVTPVEPEQSTGATRGSGGLAAVDPDRGTLVAFAARDGQVALDGVPGGTADNSPYALALMDKMVQPGLEISLMFRQVRDEVLQMTHNLQEPHTYGSLSGVPFYIAGPPKGQADLSGTDAWNRLKPDQEQQLLKLAELGDTRSMLGLAYMRLNPNEDRFDPKAAVEFLKRAAAAGSPEGEFELARLYERGVGVEQDDSGALQLYQEAAEQDYADAINDLGFFHYQGALGLRPDPKRALELFERAANLRHPQAMFNFAALIDDGLIPSKGPSDTAKYLYDALRTGSADVLKQLTEEPQRFTRQARRALQGELQEHGFYKGALDGEFGAGTKKAIRLAYGLSD